ncbi:MAG: DUF134 domain-containing protein [Firmicutes bacterium]|nr:DUF134 domain-containing protein [Bacillota bacterium]
MARPRKRRRVCYLPENNIFGPLDPDYLEAEVVIMSVEEYEAIRWIDYEGLIQEECAQRMNVARTTVQRIYNDARKKLAQALVDGKVLRIEGGDYKICDGQIDIYGCGRGHCRRHQHGHKGRHF